MTQLKNRVLIAGGTGLVGQRLTDILLKKGLDVNILTRSTSRKSTQEKLRFYNWNVNNQTMDPEALHVDYIINLAGAGIADKRWTKSRKKEILESRTLSTKLIRDTLASSNQTISHYIGASAIGIYGDSDERLLTEENVSSSSDFMVDVCHQWEDAHNTLSDLVVQLSITRIGIVLSTKGGALKEIVKPLNMGRLAPYFGDGSMIYSWIHIDDLCNMFLKLMDNTIQSGTYNAVGPKPTSNKNLIEAILSARGIAAIKMPAPTFAMKLLLGEMSNTILNSTSVSSAYIEKAGFKFAFPELEPALEDLFSNKK